MAFSSPTILWGLLALAIPIIIHLFQFKRFKTLYFPDVSLLKDIQKQSSAKNQLKHLLILFSRLALIALLVLAFAEPYIPPSGSIDQSEPTLVSIYVDNSFSMDAESEAGRLFDQAKNLAYEVAASYPKTTEFQLITNELGARERKSIDFNGLLTGLDNLDLSANGRTIKAVTEFHNQSKHELELRQSVLYLISDFEENAIDSSNLGDSLTNIRLLPLEKEIVQNVSIDSVSLGSPSVQTGFEVQLNVSLTNHSNSPVKNLPVEISIDNQNICRFILDIAENATLDTSCTFIAPEPGGHRGLVSIDEMPIVYDNQYYFTIVVNDQIEVLEIGDEPNGKTPFQKLFTDDGFLYKYQSVNQLDQGEISAAQLIIFNAVPNWTSGLISIIEDASKSGKSIFFIPPKADEANGLELLAQNPGISYSTLDTQTISANAIEFKHPLFENVFEKVPDNLNYPLVKKHWKVNLAVTDNESLIRLPDGSPLLGVASLNNGKLYYTSVPLIDDYTNFHQHALFVPAVYNMAIQSGQVQELAFNVGEQTIPLDLPLDESVIIQGVSDSLEFKPSLGVNEIGLFGQIKKSGFYKLMQKDTLMSLLSFNYNRTESSGQGFNPEAIEALSKQPNVTLLENDPTQVSQAIETADIGEQLWSLFILLALMFALLEIILLKYLS